MRRWGEDGRRPPEQEWSPWGFALAVAAILLPWVVVWGAVWLALN